MPRTSRNDTINGGIAAEEGKSGFLTKIQQELLDAAVLEKQKSGRPLFQI